MTTPHKHLASAHLSRYPNARASTLAYLIEREKMTVRLKREVRAMRWRKWLSVFAWFRAKREAVNAVLSGRG